MAEYQQRVYLGYPDELITEKYSDVNYLTNKIGGIPDWPVSQDVIIPVCPLCNLSRLLVVQVYAPLDSSPYHRTLYVFACINSNCWNENDSWLCLRSQKLEEKIEDKPVSVPKHNSETVWCQDADCWDDDGIDVNEENGNFVKSSPVEMQTDDEDASFEDIVRKDMENLVIRDTNANSKAAAVEMQGGAVGRQHSPIATAEIEGDEGEVVTVESPLSPKQNIIALLQNGQTVPQELYDRVNASLEFTSYFMSVSEEILSDVPYKDYVTEHHIRDLLQEYQQSNDEGNRKKFSKDDNVSMDQDESASEKYEKSVPVHGDKKFHNFISRIQLNPGQILRYNRGSTPLLPLALQKVPKKCKHCNGPLIFEFQVLSTIIPKLHLRNVEQTDACVDFTTVLIYTCKSNCWSDDKSMLEESVVVLSEKY